MQTSKATQQWVVGSSVRIGGREYFVQGQEPDAPKGLAKAYLVTTADQSRQYRWRPYRGLQLLNGELVRPNKHRGKKSAGPAAQRPGRVGVPKGTQPAASRPQPAPAQQITQATGVWSRVARVLGLTRRPPAPAARPPAIRPTRRRQTVQEPVSSTPEAQAS